MIEYEGQEYEDTEAQAYWDDQWFKNMEYLEAYEDASLDEEEAEAINRKLDILDLDHAARENGEKPGNEWARADFKDLLHQYPRLRHWRTRELQACFLNYTGTINSVDYYKRLSVMETWERIANGGPFNYDLADPAAIDKDSEYAFQRREMMVDRLWRLYHRLHSSTSCLLLLH